MRKEYTKEINIYGTEREIDQACRELEGYEFHAQEEIARMQLQALIDRKRIAADILFDGNTVYSYDRIIRDFKRALNSKPCRISKNGSGDYDLTDYLYKFFSLSCGSIAHFNKYGWIGTYPEKIDLCNFIFRNEFGQDIEAHQPGWHTDAIKIAKELKRLAAGYIAGYNKSVKEYARIGC